MYFGIEPQIGEEVPSPSESYVYSTCMQPTMLLERSEAMQACNLPPREEEGKRM